MSVVSDSYFYFVYDVKNYADCFMCWLL